MAPTTAPRAADYAGVMLDALQVTLGAKVDRREGSRWDALTGMLAAGFVRANQITVQQFDASNLDRAVGNDVDNYCTPRGPVRRIIATFAQGQVLLQRPTNAGGAGTIFTGSQVRVAYQGATYIFTTTADVQVTANGTASDATPPNSAVLPVVAQTPGAAPGAIGSLTTGISLPQLPTPIFDSTLAPTSIIVAAGMDAEIDPDIKTRQKAWEQGRQRGTRPAMAYGALSVPGVKHVVIADYNDPHIGSRGMMYVGDSNWNTSPTLTAAVATVLESWRPWGPSLPLGGFTNTAVSVIASVTMARPLANHNLTNLNIACVNQVMNYFNQRIDPYAYDLTILAGRIGRAHDEIAKVSITTPASSVLSPLTPTALTSSGGFPANLTRYSVVPSAIAFTFLGPT